ncbi:MAG: hypothetical protein JNL74_05825 [Fibrobacteres bacterium]|nr:hypothetical protein [Fibrobacterota bacterium]
MKTLIIISICSTLLLNCAKQSPVEPIVPETFNYPLKIGNSWTYKCFEVRANLGQYDTIAMPDLTILLVDTMTYQNILFYQDTALSPWYKPRPSYTGIDTRSNVVVLSDSITKAPIISIAMPFSPREGYAWIDSHKVYSQYLNQLIGVEPSYHSLTKKLDIAVPFGIIVDCWEQEIFSDSLRQTRSNVCYMKTGIGIIKSIDSAPNRTPSDSGLLYVVSELRSYNVNP